MRLEFPYCQFPAVFGRRAVNGVLFVFRAGSPTPIYETREVLVADVLESSNDGFIQQFLKTMRSTTRFEC